MIELRWIDRPAADHPGWMETVLQYREYPAVSRPDYVYSPGWSEWQDVPVVGLVKE